MKQTEKTISKSSSLHPKKSNIPTKYTLIDIERVQIQKEIDLIAMMILEREYSSERERKIERL